jgi:microcystin-dependent protein
MSEPFLGEIRLFGFNFAPRNWAKCDGQLLPISQNSALFSLLGTTYGGDGRTTFGLPDLRGRVSIHQGQGPGLSDRRIGQRNGAENTVLSVAHLPPHDHAAQLKASALSSNQIDPTGNSLAVGREDTYLDATPDQNMNADSVVIENTGNGQSFTNMQPYLVGNWCIALVGVFPPRN